MDSILFIFLKGSVKQSLTSEQYYSRKVIIVHVDKSRCMGNMHFDKTVGTSLNKTL
jgi:hypothetical protein